MTKLKAEKKLEDLIKKQAAIKNRISSITSRIRNEQDKRLTRKKILIGAYFLEKFKSDESKLKDMLNSFLVRDKDRSLFGLPLKPEATISDSQSVS